MRGKVVLAVSLLLAGCSDRTPAAPGGESSPAGGKTGAPGVQSEAEGGPVVNLPKQAGAWSRAVAARRIDAATIFDYMDGAGELYLAYRFDHLDVHEYKAAEGALGTLLVELYWMRTSDDAFGLLSMDWGGEAVDLTGARPPGPSTVPTSGALYGAGLLRAWSDNLYLRILASNETPAARAAVVEIARAIVSGRRRPAPPRMVTVLPANAGRPLLAIRPDSTCFFRSYLVLNSAYFLSSQDILGLTPEVEAVTTEYGAKGSRPVRAVVLRYPANAAAAAALETFVKEYVPEAVRSRQAPANERGTVKVEQGWVAWALGDEVLAIALDVPEAPSGRRLVEAVLSAARSDRSMD